jgi:two-component system, sporulation sensor kinase E
MKSGFLKKLLDRAEKIDKELIVDYMIEIAQERDLLVALFDNMIEGMIVIDDDENVVYINKSARHILDLGDGPTIPEQSLTRILLYPELLHFYREERHRLEPVCCNEFVLSIGEKQSFLQINLIPLIKNDDRFGTLLLFLDNTEQKKQEKKLREAEKLAALTTLSAGVSHEIRNPLNALSIHLQLLKRHLKKKGVNDSETEDVFQIFSTEINRLNQVIESFLAAVRPSKPQLLLVNLYSLITETLNLMEPEFLQNNIHVSLHEEGDWPLIKADEPQLKQALINILRNAVEAITTQNKDELKRKEKAVIIHLIREENNVTLMFEDTGKGIEENDLQHVFEPYFTTKPKGTGLGLMVVDRIIREHHGKLSATSEVGVGTQVTVTLPVAAEKPKLLAQGKPKSDD